MIGGALIRKALLGLGLAAVMAAGLSACERSGNGITARKDIAFSIPDSETAKARWSPLLADLAKQTGLKVRAVYAEDYDAQVAAFHDHQADAGWFQALTGVEVLSRGPGEVFAEAEGAAPYQSLIIIPATAKVTVDDLLKCDRRLSFGLGDRKRAASGQAPLYYLFQPNRIDMKGCFKAVSIAASQENIAGVVAGTLSAAAIDSDDLRALRDDHPETFAKVKVIWASGPLAEDVLIYHKDLDPVTREKVRSFFLSYGRAPGPEGDRQRTILAALQFEGFAPADNGHFVPVRLMKASVDLVQAEAGDDTAAAVRARAALEKVRAEKRALDASTAPQIMADPQPSSK